MSFTIFSYIVGAGGALWGLDDDFKHLKVCLVKIRYHSNHINHVAFLELFSEILQLKLVEEN